MRGARARSTKQKAHIARIDKLQAVEAVKEEQAVEMSSLSSRLGRKTIEVDGISKAYGDHVLFRDFSYVFLKNDRIGIIGRNGCGKSTLLRVITGRMAPDAGSVEFGSTVKVAYFAQENEELDERQKAIEYVREGAEYIRTKDGVVTASAMLERFLFDGEKQWTQISRLSGGEKRRLYLLRLLMEAPNVLVLDEPTNDLDIRTLTILEDYLDEFEGIVLTVSHDRYFLDRVVRRIFAFEEDGSLRQYEGGYSDYEIASKRIRDDRPKEQTAASEKKAAIAPGGKDRGRQREKKLKLSYREAREAETIDEEIEALETRIGQLTKDMEKFSSDFVKLNEIMEKKAKAEEELEYKMERWVYLNELKEQIENEKDG